MVDGHFVHTSHLIYALLDSPEKGQDYIAVLFLFQFTPLFMCFLTFIYVFRKKHNKKSRAQSKKKKHIWVSFSFFFS
jgi:cbb3-type cytochrome oxidase subunit 3